MKRRDFIQGAALAATAIATSGAGPQAWAQGPGNWPEKPVRLVLSQPPGSGPDTIARLLSDRIARSIGQSIVVENKPGGQNIIGAQAVARSAPDGYTFYLATTAALVSNRYLFKDMPYDPVRDFMPVAFLAKSPFAVFVRTESPIASFQDLVTQSRARPGEMALANEGPRTFGGILARVINARGHLQANLVGYASVGVAVQDVIGGHADAVVTDLASSSQLVRQGRLRLLAVSSPRRLAGWESVPTLAESLPGLDMVGWLAIVAPTGTPAPVVARLNREVNALLADADIAQRMNAIGPIAEVMGGPEQFGAFLASENTKWGAVAREIGLLPE